MTPVTAPDTSAGHLALMPRPADGHGAPFWRLVPLHAAPCRVRACYLGGDPYTLDLGSSGSEPSPTPAGEPVNVGPVECALPYASDR